MKIFHTLKRLNLHWCTATWHSAPMVNASGSWTTAPALAMTDSNASPPFARTTGRMPRLGLQFLLAAAAATLLPAQAEPATNSLIEDLRTYASFGAHRYGSTGEQAALAWMERELAAAGLKVEKQPIRMGRQLVFESGQATLGGKTYEAFPHWWPPEQMQRISLEAPLRPDKESAGAFAWLRLPYERAAYLTKEHRQKIMEVAAHKPLAIVLTIDNPAGSIFTYNVNQEDTPWPVPVIVLPARLAGELEAARAAGATLKVDMAVRLEREVESHNVIGHIDNGAARTMVISTPVSSWFTSSCERGPGIAVFLDLARQLAKSTRHMNYVFVATVGHEIGHGGMEAFIHEKAPPAEKVRAWVHLGASFACYGWTRDAGTSTWVRQTDADPSMRALLASSSLQKQVAEAFNDIPAMQMFAERSGIGELREVRAAGYPNYFGMAGVHRFFHTPEDVPENSGAELLAPLARAFAAAVDQLSTE